MMWETTPSFYSNLLTSTEIYNVPFKAHINSTKDAILFFEAFRMQAQPANAIPWANLRTLALQSVALRPKEFGSVGNWMLLETSRIAAFMPKLEIMELWYGGPGVISCFRYTNNAGKAPQITLSYNWAKDLKMDDKVINSWANLPQHSQRLHGDLIVEMKRIDTRPEHVLSGVSTLPYLALRGNFLDDISYAQFVRDEAEWWAQREEGLATGVQKFSGGFL